jgi:hypothetical protein
MDWPLFEAQWIREEYNRRKNRGKSPKRKAKTKNLTKYMGQIKRKVYCEKYPEVGLDRVGWRAAVNQSKD